MKSGEIVGLLGPNGAGKTTTFYMVVGIVPRDAGRIVIDEEDISLLPLHARARRGIGYLPQEASIFRRLSVYDNLMAVLEIRPDLTSEQREDRAKELMEEFHISHLRDSLGGRCPAVNAAASKSPARWRPTRNSFCWTNPSPGWIRFPLSTSKKSSSTCVTAALGVLITDHNVRETLDVCERAYIVSRGKLIAHGTPDAILADGR